MKQYVILIAERVTDLKQRWPTARYLALYEPDACDGYGFAEFTGRIDEALKFNDPAAAMRCWRQQSTVRPLREDGKPNRPLTAYTVEIIPTDEAEDERLWLESRTQ